MYLKWVGHILQFYTIVRVFNLPRHTSASSVLLQPSKDHDSFLNYFLPADRFHTTPVTSTDSELSGGFFLDDIEAVTRSDTLECPSANVISTRYKCQVKDRWVDCYRRHCCQGYNFVAGKCLSENIDPCSHNFCEQKCSVYFGRVICTCFSGFVFSPENHKNGVAPVCLDTNECESENGGCDHICENKPGTFSCKCRIGYKLLEDNRTCELVSKEAKSAADQEGFLMPNKGYDNVAFNRFRNPGQRIHNDVKTKCHASCSLVTKLETKIKSLEERLVALSTAVRLYSFAAGPPGPQGPSGPPGPPGKRGFPGPSGPEGPQGDPGSPGEVMLQDESFVDSPTRRHQHRREPKFSEEDFPLDSWTVLKGDAERQFCRCRRGPIGPPGPPGRHGQRGLRGEQGEKGNKGDPGSFDFLLLMMADVRHDIQKLQEKVFSEEERPDPFDLPRVLKQGYPELDTSLYKTQIQELLTEEMNNEIYGAAKTQKETAKVFDPVQEDELQHQHPQTSVHPNQTPQKSIKIYEQQNVKMFNDLKTELVPPVNDTNVVEIEGFEDSEDVEKADNTTSSEVTNGENKETIRYDNETTSTDNFEDLDHENTENLKNGKDSQFEIVEDYEDYGSFIGFKLMINDEDLEDVDTNGFSNVSSSFNNSGGEETEENSPPSFQNSTLVPFNSSFSDADTSSKEIFNLRKYQNEKLDVEVIDDYYKINSRTNVPLNSSSKAVFPPS